MRLSLRRGLGPIILLTAMHAAWAQAPRSVELEDLTWTELRDEIRAGKTTILIPIGGTEQTGPYVALGKHNARVKVLAQRIAEKLGNAIVAPVIAYVPEGGYAPPSSHMRFPGTITVPDDVFEKTLESAANSFRVHGFRNIVFLGDHGGYASDLRNVAGRLNKSWAGANARVVVPAAYYDTSSTGYNQILLDHGVPHDEAGTHGGLADTSLQLAIAPKMVRVESLKNAPKPGAADGIYGGDPRRSTAALGQLGVDAIVSRTVDAIRQETAAR